MANAISKGVFNALLDTYSRSEYVITRMVDLAGDQALGKGDVVDVPYHANPTNASPTSRAAPETLAPSVDTMSLDQEVFFNVNLPALQTPQRLGGAWQAATGGQMMARALSEMDDNLLAYLTNTLAWTTGGSYLVNAAGDSLADDDVNAVEAAILAQDGVMRQNLLWICSSYGAGSIKNVAGYVPNGPGAEAGKLGIPQIASVNGIPLVISNGVVRNKTVATTAAVTTGTGTIHTYTVAAGHGLQPGMMVTVSGHDADENIATATAITSVTSDSVVVTTAATADGTSGDATGTISCAHSFNLLVDSGGIFRAIQQVPKLDEVKDFESAAKALQLYCAYGRVGHAGRAYLMMSPGSAV